MKFEFFRRVGNAWHKTYTTQYAQNDRNPETALLKIPLSTLCNADKESEIKISAICDNVGEINRVTFKLSEL